MEEKGTEKELRCAPKKHKRSKEAQTYQENKTEIKRPIARIDWEGDLEINALVTLSITKAEDLRPKVTETVFIPKVSLQLKESWEKRQKAFQIIRQGTETGSSKSTLNWIALLNEYSLRLLDRGKRSAIKEDILRKRWYLRGRMIASTIWSYIWLTTSMVR